MVLSITAMRDGGGAIAFGRRSVEAAIALAILLETEGFTRVQVADLDSEKVFWPKSNAKSEKAVAP